MLGPGGLSRTEPIKFMAANEMPGDMMDSGYGSSDAAKVTPPEEKPSVDQENKDAGTKTALVDNKILSPEGQPLKAGDEIIVRVVKNYGTESEIEYAPKKGGEGEGGEEGTKESTPAEDFAEMDKGS